MMEKDPAKRIELLDFVDLPYCLKDDEELEEELKIERERIAKIPPKEEQEEEKFEYTFMNKMDIKGHDDKGEKKTGKKKKKKSKSNHISKQ